MMRLVDYIFERNEPEGEYLGGDRRRPELEDIDDSYKYSNRDLEIEESDNAE